MFPAGYLDDVIGVNATAGGAEAGTDPQLNVGASSATDVAAPTYGAVVLAVNGSACTLQDINTSWAAAEVSGVLALLMTQVPRRQPRPAHRAPVRHRVRHHGRPDPDDRRTASSSRSRR